jgi:hypothetical protein
MQFDLIGNKESLSRFSKWMGHRTSTILLTRYGVHPASVVPVLEYFVIDGRLTTPSAIVVDHDVVITVCHAVTVAVLCPQKDISFYDINWNRLFLKLSTMWHATHPVVLQSHHNIVACYSPGHTSPCIPPQFCWRSHSPPHSSGMLQQWNQTQQVFVQVTRTVQRGKVKAMILGTDTRGFCGCAPWMQYNSPQ